MINNLKESKMTEETVTISKEKFLKILKGYRWFQALKADKYDGYY